ncbi:tRNA wybutosine-synthesizing protein 2/3/4-like [Chenopodium quinoa]|uniref:SAM-dependent methyltransferase TRM5/TYW2-type domain-containing protein n=1 Tax=Chenopodium quinoa TaxID=63459 RepID=A0A803M1W3_CHEQI|nr:tRNA wybutosine-synthesizing protein 2/3/4-like [Chenopodium quinoa]
MEFEKRKAATMAAISSTELDKSPKGTIDAPIIPLLNTINNHPSYYTTSSCSGRISIFSHLPNKPKGGTWAFISHDPVDPFSILNLIFPPTSTAATESVDSAESTQSELVFRFEPLIIAVECKDVGAAQFLVALAISCGFRESGITSVSSKRVIVAIRCSIRLEVPLGCKGRIMVSPEYLRYLVEIANDKMGANWKRTQGFLEGLRKNGFVGQEAEAEAGDGFVGLRGGVDGDGAIWEEEKWVGVNQEGTNLEKYSGPLGSSGSSLAIVPIKIVGESIERLFIWGHSSCTICNADSKEILIYGGFGGIGRHARRSDCLLLDLFSGRLSVLDVKGSPSPRMGHTSSLVGGSMIVIGGRADPTNILDELWIFDIMKAEWKLVGNTGDVFAPRHRHAAAVVGSNIYIFGGLNNNTLYSSLVVLDVDTMKWKEVQASGEFPCARHSHSLVAYGNILFLFGGYNGGRALGDLYSFDIQDSQWAKVKTVGKSPYPRFSHSMFVYKDYLGIVGGCPVRQHCEELSLLDLKSFSWKQVFLNSIDKQLFVRNTANVVNDDLIMIGGGASCYAFGTKFSEPSMINLLSLLNFNDATVSKEKQSTPRYENSVERTNNNFGSLHHNGCVQSSNLNVDKAPCSDVGHATKTSYWVLKLQKSYAKLGKDVLKKFGWLDLSRKVYSHDDRSCIYFPVTAKFSAIFSDELSQKRGIAEGLGDFNMSKNILDSCATALDYLVACGATKHVDEVVVMKKASISPLEAMKEVVALLLKQKALSEELLDQLPTRWERLGDIVVLPITSFRDPAWDTIGSELWSAVAQTLGARRLARQGRVASTGTRDSRVEILVGDNGWVEHSENGIAYCFDTTKCMFSWGNLSEKLRMARMDCRGEVIVDLFAGIGYFTLPFLVRGNATLVYACEWNPHAVEALHHNLQANLVSDRCIVLEGDNRLTAPKGVANRVCLGLLPSSEGSWVTAIRALRCEGGTLHIHGNVKDSEENQWTLHVMDSISEIAKSEGHCWNVSVVHLERVKWYAPHIRHLVADVRCEQILK